MRLQSRIFMKRRCAAMRSSKMPDEMKRCFEVQGFIKGWFSIVVQANDEEEAERLYWEGDYDTDNTQDRYEALISSVKEWKGTDVHSERSIERCSCHAPQPADSPSGESSS